MDRRSLVTIPERSTRAMPSTPVLTTPRRTLSAARSNASMATASSVASQRRSVKSESSTVPPPAPTTALPVLDDKENRTNNTTAPPENGGKFKSTPTSSAATATASAKRPLERIYESVLDANGSVTKCSFLKGRFLGKGGFASCYEVVCERSSRKYACKLVTKRSLVKPKARSKFKSEIKIHKALRHPNVVQFERYFEDDDNAYILLELCRNQSLSDLMRRRKRLSEAEVRFYIRQLVDGLAYLHKNLVIHRDLKLGNLFLTADMKLKIGDFGLAARLDNEFDRKRTLCGTPNYIAPEILTGRSTTGHSFEVDIWSMGVVMFTLLVGKPPFETEDVKETYKRIRAGEFAFPDDVEISESAKSIVRSILRVEPHLRPSLNAILAHPFFKDRPTMASLPRSALLITPPECKRVIASNKRTMDARSYEPPPRYPLRRRDVNSARDRDHEKERAAPVVVMASTVSGTTTTTSAVSKPFAQPVVVAASAARVSRSVEVTAVQSQSTLVLMRSPSGSASGSSNNSNNASGEGSCRGSKKAVSAKNASRATTATSETMPLLATGDGPEHAMEGDDDSNDAFALVQETLGRFFYLEEHDGGKSEKLDEFSSASVIVAAAQRVKEIRLEQEAARSQSLVPATLWLSQWVDYTSKYGMGYVLSDGSSGVYFNDSTKMVCSADTMTLEYMERVAELSTAPEPFVRCPSDQFEPMLKKKVTLLSHFKSYLIDERDKKADIAAFEDQVKELAAKTSRRQQQRSPDAQRMVYVKKWVKTKHAVLFCLSNNTFQFNFFDASKLVLSANGRVATYLDKDGKLGVFSTAVAILNREPSDLTKRLRYARDMFEQIARVNATAVVPTSE